VPHIPANMTTREDVPDDSTATTGVAALTMGSAWVARIELHRSRYHSESGCALLKETSELHVSAMVAPGSRRTREVSVIVYILVFEDPDDTCGIQPGPG
jgi:hypothetical protein